MVRGNNTDICDTYSNDAHSILCQTYCNEVYSALCQTYCNDVYSVMYQTYWNDDHIILCQTYCNDVHCIPCQTRLFADINQHANMFTHVYFMLHTFMFTRVDGLEPVFTFSYDT